MTPCICVLASWTKWKRRRHLLHLHQNTLMLRLARKGADGQWCDLASICPHVRGELFALGGGGGGGGGIICIAGIIHIRGNHLCRESHSCQGGVIRAQAHADVRGVTHT